MAKKPGESLELKSPRSQWWEWQRRRESLIKFETDLTLCNGNVTEAQVYYRPCSNFRRHQNQFGLDSIYEYQDCDNEDCPRENGHGYFIEVSDVIRIIESTQAETDSGIHLKKKLLEMVDKSRPSSGCCLQCEDVAEEHESAIHEFRKESQKRKQLRDDRNTADFLIVSWQYSAIFEPNQMVHVASCPDVEIAEPVHPGSLHEYASMRYHKHSKRYDARADGSFSLMTELDFSEHYGPLFKYLHSLAIKSEYRYGDVAFCATCCPSSPKPGASPRNVPACWSWPMPSGNLATTNEPHAVELMRGWQAHRCAICGSTPGHLDLDHDHRSGLVRGYLCRKCNTREHAETGGRSEQYRRRNPADILRLEIRYGDVVRERRSRSRYLG